MRVNGGQLQELYYLPYRFIIRVRPGHLPKKAFSGRRIKFQMAYLFEYSSSDKELTFV